MSTRNDEMDKITKSHKLAKAEMERRKMRQETARLKELHDEENDNNDTPRRRHGYESRSWT